MSLNLQIFIYERRRIPILCDFMRIKWNKENNWHLWSVFIMPCTWCLTKNGNKTPNKRPTPLIVFISYHLSYFFWNWRTWVILQDSPNSYSIKFWRNTFPKLAFLYLPSLNMHNIGSDEQLSLVKQTHHLVNHFVKGLNMF